MESLPEVWHKVEYLAGILKEHVSPSDPTKKVGEGMTKQDLTDIRDDLNDCAESVQSIRDELFPE